MLRACVSLMALISAAHIAAAAAQHDPDNNPSPARIVPISAELGLADIYFDPAAVQGDSALVRFWTGDDTGWIDTPLRLVTHANTTAWYARVMAGPQANSHLRYKIIDIQDGTQVAGIEHIASTAPPANKATPAWAMGAVYYQIFPERFRNANPANDPRALSTFLKPWTSDWDAVSDAEWEYNIALSHALNYKMSPEQGGGAKYNVIWQRRYGGDLQGIVEQMDYLVDLGVTVIYTCPIFEAGSMHKYDAAAYHHIDHNFGHPGVPPKEITHDPEETADPATWKWTASDRYFVEVFLPEAKKRGLKIILDGVWNHTGRQFWAFQDVMEHGSDSPYADWYYFKFDDQGKVIGWRAWDQPNGALPKLMQTKQGDLVPPVKQHIFDITSRWMDPNGDGDPSDGIDGWRLDVANELGIAFWKDWRAHVRKINPKSMIIAEIWDDAARYFDGNSFDAQMNYPFASATVSWLRDNGDSPDGNDFQRTLSGIFDHEPHTDLVQMNLMGSHDTDRLVSKLYNPGPDPENPRGYDDLNQFHNGAEGRYNPDPPDQKTYKLSILAMALQATYPGAPCIYYGDELGMHGPDDPDNRKPMSWPDLAPFDNPADEPRPDILASYKSWFRLRSDPKIGPVLRYGSVHHLPTEQGVFAFERVLNGDRVVVVLNRSSTTFHADALLSESSSIPGDRVVAPLSGSWWFFPRGNYGSASP